jgi:hypothetical protein
MAKGISLHIGLNKVDPEHYLGWDGALNACEYDAEDMESLATDQGFETTIIKTNIAVRNTVIEAIENAAAELNSGDIFLLTYSGHGGQVSDYNRDEPDNKDETWCLYDGQLIDDELFALWPKFQSDVRIFVLSDSCHSGTVVRLALDENDPAARIHRRVADALAAEGARFKYMPRDIAARVARTRRNFYNELQQSIPEHGKLVNEIQATVRLISGCQDNQYSLDGLTNGLFTETLLRIWDQGHFEGNYTAFHRAILESMPATQSPNHFLVGSRNPVFDAQKPFEI